MRSNAFPSDLDSFYKILGSKNLHPHPDRLKFKLEKYLFSGIDFKEKKLIDIGGGSGLYSFYAAVNGVNKAVILEPEIEGSTEGVKSEFQKIKDAFPELDNIFFHPETFQQFQSEDRFDVILLNDSINHLNEEACARLLEDKSAQDEFTKIFSKLNAMATPGATLIICDCSRYNFFHFIGVKNPFMPSITWRIHQSPETWSSLLEKVGFKKTGIYWTTPNPFGMAGRFFLGNRIVSYFTFSHFMLRMKKA